MRYKKKRRHNITNILSAVLLYINLATFSKFNIHRYIYIYIQYIIVREHYIFYERPSRIGHGIIQNKSTKLLVDNMSIYNIYVYLFT